eukprot:1999011-Alexandrium_andersonii.AAC.1
MKQLNEKENLDVDAEDIASFCNKQMGVHFENYAIQLYKEHFNVHIDAAGNYAKRVCKEDGRFNWQ